jgi:hypothetical protein
MRKISPPPGLDLHTVQPVASRYTDWATLPTPFRIFYILFVKECVYSLPSERNDYLSCHITYTVAQSPIYDRVSRNYLYFKKESTHA